MLELIRDRYLAGVANAEAKYRFGEGDEDTLAGALGAEISTGRPWMVRTEAGVFKIEVKYWKLRGRGPNAPEKILGADGSFQIKVADESGTPILSKGLPFWRKIWIILGPIESLGQHNHLMCEHDRFAV